MTWISLSKKVLRYQVILVIKCINSKTGLYSVGISVLNETVAHVSYKCFLVFKSKLIHCQKDCCNKCMSLNKASAHSFFYQILHDHAIKAAMNIPEYCRNFRIFLHLIHNGFSHASTPDTLGDVNRQLSQRMLNS